MSAPHHCHLWTTTCGQSVDRVLQRWHSVSAPHQLINTWQPETSKPYLVLRYDHPLHDEPLLRRQCRHKNLKVHIWLLIFQVLLDPSGCPVTSLTGFHIAIGPDGQAMRGPDGRPLCLGPDGASLISWRGHPLLGPQVTRSNPRSNTLIFRCAHCIDHC